MKTITGKFFLNSFEKECHVDKLKDSNIQYNINNNQIQINDIDIYTSIKFTEIDEQASLLTYH